jgi:DNA-directed RNA polymerase specialized sigma24 family protein
MFGWLRRWRGRALERQLERLLAENKELKAQWRAEQGDEPLPLTAEERQALKEKRDQLSPKMRKKLGQDDFFGLDDAEKSDGQPS